MNEDDEEEREKTDVDDLSLDTIVLYIQWFSFRQKISNGSHLNKNYFWC
jgi:hypothetical protein